MTGLADALGEVGRELDARGWVPATGGNLSAVTGADPTRLIITASGSHKGRLSRNDFVEIDEDGDVLEGPGRPSNEALLHLVIVRQRAAGAVLHTHSAISTLVSLAHVPGDCVTLSGLEMLKAFQGVEGPDARITLPVLENAQHMPTLAALLDDALSRHDDAAGVLVRGHGLYTWGEDVAVAQRHLEALEFLLEVTWRGACPDGTRPPSR